jgi:hypothetical protein
MAEPRTTHPDGWFHNTDDHWHRVAEDGRYTLVACPDITTAIKWQWQLFDRDGHVAGSPNLVADGGNEATVDDAKACAEKALRAALKPSDADA